MSATDNIVPDDLALNNLALGARLRVAELADVQDMPHGDHPVSHRRLAHRHVPRRMTHPPPTTCSN